MIPGYPFSSVRVYPAYGEQQARIVWNLSADFPGRRPYRFYVQKSPNGVDRWEQLNADPLIDIRSFTDSAVGMFNKDYNLFYRVMVGAKDDKTLYTSLSQGLYGNMDRDQFLVAREIMRRHITQMRHRGGLEMLVLIRKRTGNPCPDCRDQIAGAVVAANACTTCYGTGIVGGFDIPIATYGFVVDGEYDLKLDGEGLELAGQYGMQIQTIGFPILARGDVLILPETDERCDVQKIKRHELKSFPVAQTFSAARLPVSDIVYRFPSPSFDRVPIPVRRNPTPHYDPMPNPVHPVERITDSIRNAR